MKNGSKQVVSLKTWVDHTYGVTRHYAYIKVTTRQEFYEEMMSSIGCNAFWTAFETIKEANAYIAELKKDGYDFSSITTETPEDYKE